MKKNHQERFRTNSSSYIDKHNQFLARKGKVFNRFKEHLTDSIGSNILIHAPERISIYSFDETEKNAFIDTINFRDELHKKIKDKNCIIDFSNTISFTAAAMLVIFSQIEKLVLDLNIKITIGWSRKSKAVNNIIKRSGLVRLLRSGKKLTNIPELNQLPVITGVGNLYIDDIVDFIQQKIYSNKMDPDTEYKIGDAVAETVNNVGLHAYPKLTSNSKQWWMICDVIDDQLFLAIYDTGVGIPKTVVEKKWFLTSLQTTYPEEYRELKDSLGDIANDVKFYSFNKLKDAELIYMSMQGDVTGTKKSKHGQGSKSIKALVNDTDGGKLWVYSNKGLYKFEPGDKTPQVYKLPIKLNGTLIQWNIKIQ